MPTPLEAALEVAGRPDPNDEKSALRTTQIHALLNAHAIVNSADRDRYKIEAVEQTVVAPLWNPDSGKPSRTFTIAGKLDLCVQDREGHRIVIDHKTCSESIDSEDSRYRLTQIVQGQFLHYRILEDWNNRPVHDVMLNVTRKPGIEPRQKVEKIHLAEIENRQRYFGVPVSREAAEYARDRKGENLELYGARLFADAVAVKPSWYFARFPLHLLKDDVEEYARELWQDAIDIRDERKRERHTRSGKACTAYGVACQFLNICSGYDKETSDRWMRVRNVHEELVNLPGESRNYLTNSRLQMFKLCRKKHHFLYEMGIRRQEPSAARDFGILWHDCLRAYYETMQQEQQQQQQQIKPRKEGTYESISAGSIAETGSADGSTPSGI